MSPGRFTVKYTTKLANSLKRKRLLQAQRSAKRRRLELKSERLSKDATHSVLEGETYSTNIGFDECTDIEDITIPSKEFSVDSSSLIVFDLETTGLARTSDILQIACVCGDREFSVYTRPTCTISIGASAATGLTYYGGVLKLKGEAVDSLTILEGLEQFIAFVSSFPKAVLIGHNIISFDIPVLMHNLFKHNLLERFQEVIFGFVDTLKLSKRIYPKAEMGNYRQENLVQKLLGETYNAHNAASDVEVLQRLFHEKLKVNCNGEDLVRPSYYSCKSSLEPLVKMKVISAATMSKLVGLSLNLAKLKIIHKRDPNNGIRNVFSDPIANSRRCKVSKSKAVIEKVVQYLSNI